MQGILMTPDNHKAIRDKLKTQTRRLDHLKEINKAPDAYHPYKRIDDSWIFRHSGGQLMISVKPRYKIGEVIYIKEAYEFYNRIGTQANIKYIRDGLVTWVYIPKDKPTPKKGYHSPLFLPEWTARDYIKSTDVRPERLQDITEEDAFAEGMPFINVVPNPQALYPDINGYRRGFVFIWNEINGKTYPFDSNPWCWRICFNLIEDKQ